ncbi:hypothetical protein FSP39_020510 [Pinctada imbricata]|uniref:Glycosyl hydrolase family 13 catalytic domain-containing protein n=1 Tax=Pinctada imbricata TaxID=66713 RepID=A0AA88Y8A2_PINIB|nr:hypothetical protein FSP39_020510 [Pinctada imbricata]
MADDEKKRHFCEGNKCLAFIFVVVIAAIVTVAVVTFVDKEIRTVHKYDNSKLPWWKQTVVYQIYPRSFQDTDGDGIGDLNGITKRLDYIQSLGVGAIWLSPFYSSPQRDFGYDISNYTEVDRRFGTMKDFERLMNETRKRNIKVIVDFVPNHTSNESMWFYESRRYNDTYKDYYIWSPGIKRNGTNKNDPPNNWLSVFGGSAWKYDEIRREYYYHAFLESQPDLNVTNKEVQKELQNALTFWLEKGVAGFRLDALKFMFEAEDIFQDEVGLGEYEYDESQEHNLTTNMPEIYGILRSWRKLSDGFKDKHGVGERFIVAESYGLTHAIRDDYYRAGSVPFNFDLIMKLNNTCNGHCVRKILEESLAGLGPSSEFWPNFVMGNHDRSRVASRLGADMLDAMNMMLLTLPGTPTCYYGDEIGMTDASYTFEETKDPQGLHFNKTGYMNHTRDPERSPMQWNDSRNAGFSNGTPWLHVNPNYVTLNARSQSESNSPTSLQMFRELVKLRKIASFNNYNITFIDTAQPEVLAYIRFGLGQPKYVVAMNIGGDNNEVITDFSKSANSIVGRVSVMTPRLSKASGLKNKGIKLSQIGLRGGDGMVIEVLP